MSSPHVNPHSQQSLNALSANEHKGKEESSFLPDYVPIQEQKEKRIFKKVRFHDDDQVFGMSAEKKPPQTLPDPVEEEEVYRPKKRSRVVDEE